MIDSKILETNLEEAIRRLKRKGEDEANIRAIAGKLKRRKSTKTALDNIRAEMNVRAREIGDLVAAGDTEGGQAAKQEVGNLKARLLRAEDAFQILDDEVNNDLLRLPNFPSDDCPDGLDASANVVLRVENYDSSKFSGKKLHPHWELGERLEIYDAKRASKMSGSMFSVLRGDGSRLLQALVQLGLSLNRGRYEEVTPPHFVSSATLTATGHLPRFASDAYKIHEDDLWAIPTGEVPLMGLHREEILDAEDLPKRYMAYTVCFRREAGSAGKDTRGLQRLHEFHKVELLKICTDEQLEHEFQGMLADAEQLLKVLDLPYRVVDLCAGDLTFSSARIFDLEVYSPGVDKWLEVSSVGKFGDFQARRGNIRYRDPETGKLRFPQALNGSAVATPRVWAAIIENNQQPDGTVRIPQSLQEYMGKETISKRQSAKRTTQQKEGIH